MVRNHIEFAELHAVVYSLFLNLPSPPPPLPLLSRLPCSFSFPRTSIYLVRPECARDDVQTRERLPPPFPHYHGCCMFPLHALGPDRFCSARLDILPQNVAAKSSMIILPSLPQETRYFAPFRSGKMCILSTFHTIPYNVS